MLAERGQRRRRRCQGQRQQDGSQRAHLAKIDTAM